MKYMTIADVKKMARGPRSALKASIKHWKQNARLTEDEAEKIEERGVELTDGDLCGLCEQFNEDWNDCPKCPLMKSGQNCYDNDSLYAKARDACGDWGYDDEPFSNFTKASKNMVKVLESLL